MKSFIVVLLVVALVVVDTTVTLEGEMAEMAKMLQENCAAETGVNTVLLEEISNGADLMPDPKLKCYLKCVMETAGVMSDGAVQLEVVLAVLPEELLKFADTLRTCGTQKGVDDCDTAFQTQVCWQKSNKEDYFFI